MSTCFGRSLSNFLFLFKCTVVTVLLLAHSPQAKAQSKIDLTTVKVEELSDDQLRQLMTEANRLGLSDAQIEQLAIQQGMSPETAAKLKTKLQVVRSNIAPQYVNPTTTENAGLRNKINDSILNLERAPLNDYNFIFNSLVSKNWGAQIFNNRNLSFEPSLKIPTPKNYILATDDELLVDVSGYSEANYRLKVSAEGVIRIPMVGAVTVSGLSIEQAKRIITQKLAGSIYRNINSGKTFVDVTLGNLRSIKISVIGEATLPGTYTLPSVASAYHALYACGGPGANGSYRNIQLIRNNVVIAVIDVYAYLATGTKKNDIRLMDEDVIKINTYSLRIELKGEVKKPGMYDVAKGETLGDILQYAGGFTDNAYTARIQTFSNTNKDRQVTTITYNEFENTIPKKGDAYVIGKILNRFTNRISINGAVYRPGEYQLKNGMKLSELIAAADGLREDAFTKRAVIHRYKDDLSPEIISFDVAKIIDGSTPDIVLKREDKITIYSKFDLKQGRFVSIQGEVQNPGLFLYEEGMHLQDLILMAGGFREAATQNRIEVSRRLKLEDSIGNEKNSKTALIFQHNTAADLSDSAVTSNFSLVAFDEVVIRRAPGYNEQKNVVVEGEVAFTGKYTLQFKTDKISDLVKRAGGLTPFAYVKGAVLVRTKNLTKTEQYNNQQGLSNLLKQNYQAGAPEVLLQNQLTQKSSETVGIDLEKIIDNPGTGYDLLLNDGDTLRIPKLLQTVRVNGEVLYPTLVRYDEDYKFKDYIIGAGGFAERSAKKRSYVVNANGSAKGTKSFFFIKKYPRIGPGAEIFVPVKKERERLKTAEVITLSATLATLAAVIFNALK
jgi:protein involved in polysaccharide export with SLBB domain